MAFANIKEAVDELATVVAGLGKVVAALTVEVGREDLLDQVNNIVQSSRERMNPGITKAEES